MTTPTFAKPKRRSTKRKRKAKFMKRNKAKVKKRKPKKSSDVASMPSKDEEPEKDISVEGNIMQINQIKPISKATQLARNLASCVKTLHQKLRGDHGITGQKLLDIEPIAEENLIVLATRMIERRRKFKKKRRKQMKEKTKTTAITSYEVDIGYHYTPTFNMASIELHGLLSKKEREEHKIGAEYNGSIYGQGVYTCDNFRSAERFGDTGIFVARLKGVCEDYASGYGEGVNTRLVPSTAYTILKRSDQCCPIMRYKKETDMWSSSNGYIDQLAKYQEGLQCVLDQVFKQK